MVLELKLSAVTGRSASLSLDVLRESRNLSLSSQVRLVWIPLDHSLTPSLLAPLLSAATHIVMSYTFSSDQGTVFSLAYGTGQSGKLYHNFVLQNSISVSKYSCLA